MIDHLSLPKGIQNLTFGQLRTFVYAARSGSFVRTAEKLQITQPAVSEQIKALEETLCMPLFLRRRGTTPILTDDGQKALDAIELVLGTMGSLFDRPSPSVGTVKLRISVGPMVKELCFRPLMAQIYRDHPELEIELHPMLMSADALRMIECGDLDLAIHDAPEDADPASAEHPTFMLPLALIARPGTQDRLSKGQCSLDNFQFIFPVQRDRRNERWASRCLSDLHMKPKHPPQFIEYVDVISKLVQTGPSIGYLMADAVRDEIEAGRLEQLNLSPPPMRRYVSRSLHSPPIAREIEHMLCEALTACSAQADRVNGRGRRGRSL